MGLYTLHVYTLATTLHHDYIIISLPVGTEGLRYKPVRPTPTSEQTVSLKEKKVAAVQKSVKEEFARRRAPLKKDIPEREAKEMRKEMATLASKGVTALRAMEVAEEEEEGESERSYYTPR